MYLVAYFAGQIKAGFNPITEMRTAYWGDQLGYLSISANVVSGHFDNPEPLTVTGVNYYPRFYYTIVGVISRLTGMDSVMAWNVTGTLIQLGAVVVLAVVMSILCRRWWVGLLAPAPFLTGTFSVLLHGHWFSSLQSHAVLWGPYGALFSKNAEGAGLSLGVIAMSLLMWVWASRTSHATRWIVTIAAAAAVGMLSSFQTYSFLTMTYVLAFACATAAISRSRRWKLLGAVSVGLLIIVIIFGPALAEQVGQLPTLVFGLLPALPGLIVAVVWSGGLVAAAGVAAIIAAAPQILWTVSGILGDDPFLVYRVASNHDLGAASWQALISALPVLVPLVGAAVIGIVLHDTAVIGGALGTSIAVTFLALNDLWGANAEPYRFWINGFFIGGVAAALCWARIVRRRYPALTPDAVALPSDSSDTTESTTASGGASPTRPLDRRTRVASTIILAVTAVLFVGGLPDWLAFARDDALQASWNPHSDRENAITAVARSAMAAAPSDLIVAGPCVDPLTTKVNTGAPMAYYRMGMAWPAEREAIDGIHSAISQGTMDFHAMDAASARWVITDSACATDWPTMFTDSLDLVDQHQYVVSGAAGQEGTISLWRVGGN